MESSQLIARELQKEAILIQKKKRKNRFLKILVLLLLVIIISLFAVYYFSPLSKIETIKIVGDQVYSDADLEKSLLINKNDSILFLNKNKIFDPDISSFIDRVDIKVDYINRGVNIKVYDKDIIGYFLTSKINVVSNDGSIAIIDDKKMDLITNKVRFSNFDKNILLKLVAAIKNCDPVLYNNISEIILDPKSYDESSLRIIMEDGVNIYTSISSFESLKVDLYKDMLNLLNEDNRCIKYDVFMKNAYAFKCPTK